MTVTPQNLSILVNELNNKGTATSCPPDNFSFLKCDNKDDYLEALNSPPLNNECRFDAVEIDAPWGNCVAIYKCQDGMKEEALIFLNAHADNSSKEFDVPRSW